MYQIARNILFCLDPELSHHVSLDWIAAAERLKLLRLFTKDTPYLPCKVMGIDFPNPIGLAAGLDKNGDYFNALGALGFGFVEIGTVTPKPQDGNPKPRLFRIPEHRAIINRMGFNNKGVHHLVDRVSRLRKYNGVLGINIGKNKVTPEEQALDDYNYGLEAVYDYADYVTINISSPNTPGLRDLQFGENLKGLLNGVKAKQKTLSEARERYVPLAVKIAPDMSLEELKSVADTLQECEIDGVIATNTTISRDGLGNSRVAKEAGGLSGQPVTQKSTELIANLSDILAGSLPIIGVGGILSGQDALNKLDAGASLVQIYSGFIYEGPKLIHDIANSIVDQKRFAGKI